jgi:hypothetical protein
MCRTSRGCFASGTSARFLLASQKGAQLQETVTLVSEKTKVRGLSAREVYTVKPNQTQSAPKKKDFVTLVDAHGKEHKINVHANPERKLRRRTPTRPSLCLLSAIIWRNAGRPSVNMI